MAELMKLLARLLVLGALAFSGEYLLFGEFPLSPPRLDDYMAAAIDKVELLRRVPSPRIVIVGGSAAGFGISSERLAAPGRPAINLGLHGGIGFRMHLDEALGGARSGDVLVLIPEYRHFFTDSCNWDSELLNYLLYSPASWRNISSWCQLLSIGRTAWSSQRDHLVALRTRVNRAQEISPSEASLVYTRKAFAPNGDMVGHLRFANKKITPHSLMGGSLDSRLISHLERSVRKANDRGIRVAVAYPCYQDASFSANRAKIDQLDVALRATSLGPLLLGNPADFVLADDEIYDTAYHLNGRGRDHCTSILLARLGVSHVTQPATGK